MRTIALLYLLPLLGLFSCCQKNPIIHNIYVDVLENGKDTITLTDYTDFEWDRALLFQEMIIQIYSHNHRDSIEKRFNISLEEILPYQEYEFKAPLVFLLNNKVTHIEENYRDTFPNDEDMFKKEKLWSENDSKASIVEIKKRHCRFKARHYTSPVCSDQAVLLEPLP